MAYYLRQEKKKNGIYLQMYESYWDKEKKQPRSRSVKAFGYVHELTSEEIPNPIEYYQNFVEQENKKRSELLAEETRPRAFEEVQEVYAGHMLFDALLKELNVKETIDILATARQFKFNLYDLISQLIYARILKPSSKAKTASSVFPYLYKGVNISEDQIYDGCEFLGSSYRKYIELFNHSYEALYKRDFSKVFFDCTNYYFEIDLPYEDKQKGPSKENKHNPIIGQALLLDADLVPLAMQMYPGNESEKPYIRKTIEEMKQRHMVTGKTIQVADKGLNCARNIYAATKEANDGYIFSKSIHGKGLSEKEKMWLTFENEANVFSTYRDDNGNILFRLKSCIDTFEYEFEQLDPETGKTVKTKFTQKEKRIVSYNPSLAAKQKAEIMKMVDKATNFTTYKKLTREELGDASKYVDIVSLDKAGKKINPTVSINQEKINEDLKFAGYNLLVTSELHMKPLDVYNTYHNLWKIEESFRLTKSYLDARPVYVRKKETIYGHFLICYLSLFLLRVLEIKCFRGRINAYDLIEFSRDFRLVKKGDGTFVNISKNETINRKIGQAIGLTNLDALYLTETELDKMFKNCLKFIL